MQQELRQQHPLTFLKPSLFTRESCGSTSNEPGSSSKAAKSSFKAAKVLVRLLLVVATLTMGCSIWHSEGSGNRSGVNLAPFQKPTGLIGALPLRVVFSRMVRDGYLVVVPQDKLINVDTLKLAIGESTTWADVIGQIEGWYQLVYSPQEKCFVEANATHPVDSPDDAGRITSKTPLRLSNRVTCGIHIRFVRASLSSTLEQLAASANSIELVVSAIAGVPREWSAISERSYYDTAVSQYGVAFPTTRQTVPAGITMHVLPSLLPGGRFRMTGTLTVSAFSGTGSDRNVTDIPIDLDGYRNRWHLIFRTSTVDATIAAALSKWNLAFRAGIDGAAVLVYMD